MRNDAIRRNGFALYAAYILSALCAAFLILAVVASCSGGWFLLPGFLIGLALAAAVPVLASLSGRLPGYMPALLCVLLCVLIRLFWVLCTRMEMGYDFARYLNTAAALAEGSALPERAYQAMFPHVLGYPAALSLKFRLFGSSLGVAQAFNIVLDAASCLLIWRIGSKHLGERAGLIAALLLAVNPNAVLHAPICCSEPLYMLLMLGAIALFERLHAGEDSFWCLPVWLLLGVLTGLFNAVRPLGPILLIAFCACHLVFGRARLLKKLLPLGLLTGAYLLTGSIYFMWAERALEKPVAGGAPGWNLYLGMNARTHGMWTASDFKILQEKLDAGREAPDIQADFMSLALERVRENFGRGEMGTLLTSKFASVWGRDNAMLYWMQELEDRSSPRARGDFKIDVAHWSGLLETACGAYWWGLLLLCVPAAYLMFRKVGPPNTALTCAVILIGIVLALLALESNARYHYPADALLALIAGWGCGELSAALEGGPARRSGKGRRGS